LLPFSRILIEVTNISKPLAASLVFISSFVYFGMSTASKIEFASLLHHLVGTQQVASKVYGFVGTLVTVWDVVAILGVGAIFSYCGTDRMSLSLGIVGGIYLCHGIFEAIVGPLVILQPRNQREPLFVNQFPSMRESSQRDSFEDWATHRARTQSSQFVVEDA